MKKEWYIFINSGHVGPYSLVEMKAFYEKKDISDSTLIWKEGIKEWLPIKDADLFSPVLNDVPPPLPPEVFKLSNTPIKGVSIPTILRDESTDTSDEELEIENVISDNDKIEVRSEISPKTKQIIISGLFLTILVAGFLVFNNSSNTDLNITGISPSNREILENQLAVDEGKLSFALALAMDKGNVWISTNQKNNLSVTVDLHADPNRILSDELDNSNDNDIIIRLQGMIKNHLGQFKSMKMLKGLKFYPGEYNVHITGKKIHWLNKFFKLNIHDLNEDFSVNLKSLIYSGNARDFERKLVERRSLKIAKSIKPLQEKLETLQTLKSLNDKTMIIFWEKLQKVNKGKEFNIFEKSYIQEISPIIQAIMVSVSTVPEKNKTFVNNNDSVLEIGKKIGENASEMIMEISKQKKIDLKNKQKFHDEFQMKTDIINKLITLNINLVENQIKVLQK